MTERPDGVGVFVLLSIILFVVMALKANVIDPMFSHHEHQTTAVRHVPSAPPGRHVL